MEENKIQSDRLPETNIETTTNKLKRKIKEVVISVIQNIIIIGLAIALGIFLRQNVMSIASVKGISMYPTLKEDEKLILNRLAKNFEYEDIVVLHPKFEEDGKMYIKRVIGLEGDTIEIKDGKVFKNGKELNEDYLQMKVDTEPMIPGESKWQVGKDEMFVLGDNRENSSDSRAFGVIKFSDIRGRANLRILPIENFGWIVEK